MGCENNAAQLQPQLARHFQVMRRQLLQQFPLRDLHIARLFVHFAHPFAIFFHRVHMAPQLEIGIPRAQHQNISG